ncbi:MAG: TIGR03862 family flavoprotein [Gemmobacter sp.]
MTNPAVTPDALVIGAGPAGLMAAEVLAGTGARILLAEAKPSVGRKLLMAGKSGLNLTKAEDPARFAAAYDAAWLAPMLAAFGPGQVADWCRGLGQPVFTGSSGRVFPVAMKASPLLRAWLARLAGQGVELRTRWRWTGLADGAAFDTPTGPVTVRPRVTLLALGGASWARLGSDGAWAGMLAGAGIPLTPFRPSNVAFAVRWSPQMARHFGTPVKGVALCLPAGRRERGEFVLTATGLEGGGLYAIGRALLAGQAATLDLAPDLDLATLSARLRGRAGETIANRLRKAGLPPVSLALAQEWGRPLPQDAGALAARIKSLPLRHAGPGPMDGAISTAGGVAQGALTDDLELRALPGVFACGEMLDWDAPTGGYLLTACLATGRWAGLAAARRLAQGGVSPGRSRPSSG